MNSIIKNNQHEFRHDSFSKREFNQNITLVNATLDAALIAFHSEQFHDCIEILKHVIHQHPQQQNPYILAAYACLKLKDESSAHFYLDQAILHVTDLFQIHIEKGRIYHEKLQFKSALNHFNLALALQPNSENTYIECGNTLLALEKYEFALAHFEFALQLNPNGLTALNSQTIALINLKRYEEALFNITCVIDQQESLKPNHFASALLNRGNIYSALGQHDEAIRDFKHAISVDPNNTLAYCNLANSYLDQNQIDLANTYYSKALETDPSNLVVHWNIALFYLLMGHYEAGWQYFESGRYASGSIRAPARPYSQPMWLGEESIQGKRLLLIHEQGFGDTLQFVRYVQFALNLGATVILEVPTQLISLLKSSFPSIQIIGLNEENVQNFVEFDYHCSLMSLPLAFKTTLNNIPANIPYLFVNREKCKPIKLVANKTLNIGLVWSGSTTHNNDLNRSITLNELTPLFSLNATFHCLQKEIREADLATLNQHPEFKTYLNDLKDFSDTAALIHQLDLVITVDTSVAHLAGALGKPVWILLPSPPDYRWMLNRVDSPWYPTATLFRQEVAGHWIGVIEKVIKAIASWELVTTKNIHLGFKDAKIVQ